MYNHAPPDYACPFCRNIHAGDGDFPVEVIHRDDDVIVKMSPKWWPNNPGHVLVIPLRHHENVYDLPPELGAPIQRAARAAAVAMKAAYGCDGVSTRQHNEPAGNQDVWHYHLHVFPRWEGDHLYGARGTWADPGEMKRRADQLRAHWPAADEPAPPERPDTTADDNVIVGCCNLIEHEGTYLLVRESKPSARARYNFPAGKPHIGETLVAAAVREANEESGLEVDVTHLVGLYQCPQTSEGFGVVNFVFAAAWTGGRIVETDAHPEVRFFTRDEVAALGAARQLRGTHIELAIDDHTRGRTLPLELVRTVPPSPF